MATWGLYYSEPNRGAKSGRCLDLQHAADACSTAAVEPIRYRLHHRRPDRTVGVWRAMRRRSTLLSNRITTTWANRLADRLSVRQCDYLPAPLNLKIGPGTRKMSAGEIDPGSASMLRFRTIVILSRTRRGRRWCGSVYSTGGFHQHIKTCACQRTDSDPRSS